MPEDRSAFDEAYTAAVGRAGERFDLAALFETPDPWWRIAALPPGRGIAEAGSPSRPAAHRRAGAAGEPLSVTPARIDLQPVREATVDERGTRPDRIVVSIDLMSLLDTRAPHRVRLRNHTPAPPPQPLPCALNPLL